MTGYQEVLTDPSYRGQMVVMTCPHIGNYGINPEDSESLRPHVEAIIVREVSEVVSNWRACQSLAHFLHEYNIIGLTDVDTRALTMHIRTRGAMKGIVSTQDLDAMSLVQKARAAPDISAFDLVSKVTCAEPYEWTLGTPQIWKKGTNRPCKRSFHVVVYDFGVKHGILRSLVDWGCRVTVVPASTPAAEAMALRPDGILLSNGPGDPEKVHYAIEATRSFIRWGCPLFGICLGHQILGLAMGGRTYKLKFGHHGGNHPVKDIGTGRVQITTQNHNFVVDISSLKESEVALTHINLNDHTVEGMRHRRKPIFSVQYHPEASPGPKDANGLFGEFIEAMEKFI